jgi:hypothetical protein
MTQLEAVDIFTIIKTEYDALKEPKYKFINNETFRQQYEQILSVKDYFMDNGDYKNLLNAMAQITKKINRLAINNEKQDWRNVSERGMNKAIMPVTKKGNQPITFPLQWVDGKTKETCFINNGYWGVKNFMVMDVLGYFLLLRTGKSMLPKEPFPIFSDLDSITKREKELDIPSPIAKNQPTMSEQDVEHFLNMKYYVHFNDDYFRKFTSTKLSSSDILNLLLDTSRVEFKLVYPVRLQNEEGPKQDLYYMNIYSRFFEFGSIDKKTRSDGIVQSREYYIGFNTILGELFAHNLLAKNYDWVEPSFYTLPYSAQILYRRFLIHNNYLRREINLETIADRLNLKDKNTANLIRTIEESAIKPLLEQGLIHSYEKEEGLHGLKYIIHRLKRDQPNMVDIGQ